jgi:hypothetical protein
MPDRGILFIYVRYIRANLASFTLSLKAEGIFSYLLINHPYIY